MAHHAPPAKTSSSFFAGPVFAWIVAGVLALALIAVSVAWATSSSAPAVSVRPGPFPGVFGGGAGRSLGRGVFGGGLGSIAVAGTVTSVAASSFTVSAVSGQSVTVDESSSTSYYSGTSSASASVVVRGANVVVQGTRSGDTVTATRVVVVPAGFFGG